jgi:hypothetical protein
MESSSGSTVTANLQVLAGGASVNNLHNLPYSLVNCEHYPSNECRKSACLFSVREHAASVGMLPAYIQ